MSDELVVAVVAVVATANYLIKKVVVRGRDDVSDGVTQNAKCRKCTLSFVGHAAAVFRPQEL